MKKDEEEMKNRTERKKGRKEGKSEDGRKK